MVEKYSAFKPKSEVGLKKDYPEIRENPELRPLKRSELLFSWWIGCESSPLNDDPKLVDLPKQKKIKIAIEESYGKLITKDAQEDLLNGRFSRNIQVGIDFFESVKPGLRVRVLKLAEDAIKKLESFVRVDTEGAEFKTTDDKGNISLDMSKRKQYADMVINITKNLPSIIRQAEQGYSIYIEEEDETTLTGDGRSLMDMFHDEN